jgi:hypothetical protein
MNSLRARAFLGLAVAIGVIGCEGPTGSAGPVGETGPTGPTGPQGSPGAFTRLVLQGAPSGQMTRIDLPFSVENSAAMPMVQCYLRFAGQPGGALWRPVGLPTNGGSCAIDQFVGVPSQIILDLGGASSSEYRIVVIY